MRRHFSVVLAVIAVITVIYSAHAGFNDALVAYYPFDGTAGDASGNGNDGMETTDFENFLNIFIQTTQNNFTVPLFGFL